MMTRADAAMSNLIATYLDRIKAKGILGGFPYVMFFTPERVEEVVLAGGPWIVLAARDVELAKQAWEGRADPHGWSPSEERTVPVIAPRV